MYHPPTDPLQRFLSQTGGYEGGWDNIDHTTFVRIRTQFKVHVLTGVTHAVLRLLVWVCVCVY